MNTAEHAPESPQPCTPVASSPDAAPRERKVGFSAEVKTKRPPRPISRQQTPRPPPAGWVQDEEMDEGDPMEQSEVAGATPSSSHVVIDPAAIQNQSGKTLSRKPTPACLSVDQAAVQHARQMRMWGEPPPDGEQDRKELSSDLTAESQ